MCAHKLGQVARRLRHTGHLIAGMGLLTLM